MKRITTLVLLTILGCSPEENQVNGVVTDKVPSELYSFIGSLVNTKTGLVSSRSAECFTTVYKNSLAAMVFLHENNIPAAENILDVFNSYYNNLNTFDGFPQDWDACKGIPTNTNYWEGDNAFLLLALNYYEIVKGSNARYSNLRDDMVRWLASRADYCNMIVAEGVANMFAALKPYESDPLIQEQLDKLANCFNLSVDYRNVLDHTVRGALVFCNTSGFRFLNNFNTTDTWAFDGQTKVTAYSAFQAEHFINIEISAQLLLTASQYPSGFPRNHTALEKELRKVLLHSNDDPGLSGLPYYVVVPAGVNWNPASLPIIDPTCYLLFYYWGFNPFSPDKNCSK